MTYERSHPPSPRPFSRLLFVHASADLYGADIALLQLVSGLDRDRFRATVIVPYEGPLVARLRGVGVEVIVYPDLPVLRRRYMNPLGILQLAFSSARSIRWLMGLMRERDFAVVQSNTLAVLISGGMAARLARRPHVWHVHEILTHPRIVALALATISSILSTVVIANSKATADHYRKTRVAGATPVKVIPNGVDETRVRRNPEPEDTAATLRRRIGARPDDVVFALIGRVNQIKGHSIFLDAAERCIADGTKNVYFLMVGDSFMGLEHLSDAVDRRVRASSKLRKRAVRLPHIADVAQVYAASDVIVVPSVEPESFGLVAAEAMAAGLPVIASRIGALPEVVEDQRTGILVEPGSSSRLSEAMEDLAGSPPRRAAMGRAGRGRFDINFRVRRYVEEFSELYEGLTNDEREGSRSRANGEKIIFCGTRGIPANYGGFETAVDELSRRFVERGHDCAVVCRESSANRMDRQYEGRKLVYVKGSSVRKLDTFVSALQTGLHLLRHRKDYRYAFWFNNANLPGILLTLLARVPFSVNTDGLEWRRAKWRWPFKAYYFLSSWLVARLCGSLISDSRAIQSYYRRVFFRSTHFIPYGIPNVPTVAPEKEAAILREYGVEAGRYFLQITRFEPDNLPLNTAKAFRDAGLASDGFKLLLIGYQHATPYAERIREMSKEQGIVVADAVYDAETLAALRNNCFCYVHGNSVGGTNPALLEAMASTPRVLAIAVPFSHEILGETGYFFTLGDMAASMRGVIDSPEQRRNMLTRVKSRYDWEAVGESYIRLANGKPAAYSPDGTMPHEARLS